MCVQGPLVKALSPRFLPRFRLRVVQSPVADETRWRPVRTGRWWISLVCCGLRNETALALVSIWVGEHEVVAKDLSSVCCTVRVMLLTKKERARLAGSVASLLLGVKALSAGSCYSGFLATNRNPWLGVCWFGARCPHQTLQVVFFKAKTRLLTGFLKVVTGLSQQLRMSDKKYSP